MLENVFTCLLNTTRENILSFLKSINYVTVIVDALSGDLTTNPHSHPDIYTKMDWHENYWHPPPCACIKGATLSTHSKRVRRIKPS